jgi:general secretion pathway protein N
VIARPQPVLGATLVLLLALTAWPWLRAPAPDRRTQPGAARGAALPVLPPLEQFRETTERPLFAPNRRPTAAVRAAPPLGLRLEGVMVIGSTKRAVIKQADGQTARVGEGDRVGEWTVREITADRVMLGAGERRLELAPQRAPRSPGR